MFESLLYLKARIEPKNQLEVMHGSHIWTANFEWIPPLNESRSKLLEDEKKILPNDYMVFLGQMTNGCLLYNDMLYGQWGYKLFSIDEINDKQLISKERFGIEWRDSFTAFADMNGESHILLFNRDQPNSDKTSYAIYEGNPIDKFENWTKVSSSFSNWIDHLITAQGDKYWEWK